MANIEDLRKQLEDLRIIDEEAYKAALKNLRVQKQLKAQLDQGKISLEEYNEAVDSSTEKLGENTKQILDTQKALHEATKAQEALNKATGLLTAGYDKLTSTFDAFTGMQTSSLKGTMDQVTAIRDLSFRIQGLSVDIRRQTGFANRHTKTFMGLRNEFLNVGLTSEDVSKSIISLSRNFSAFDAMAAENRKNLVSLSKDFAILGVDFETFAAAQERIRFSFGLTSDAAIAATKRMEDVANITGRPLEAVLKDLSDVGPELARFGAQGIQVFEGLARRARSLGLGVKEAFDITELFDTFEGAANVAGRLNAQLGLQLNSVELMRASSEERLDILRSEFQLQGKNFETMDRRQKQMIAGILGVSVEQAAKTFGEGMDIGAFRAEKTPQELLVKSQDRAAAAMEQLTEALISKNPLTMAMGDLSGVISTQANAIQGLGEQIGTLATGLGTAGGVSGAIGLGSSLLGAAGDIAMITDVVRGGRGGRGPRSRPKGKAGLFSRIGESIFGKKYKGGQMMQGGGRARAGGQRAGGIFSKLGKLGGKSAIKKIPLLGLGAGILFAGQRALAGDFSGAGLEILSGAAGTVPGLGTAASVGLDAALAAKDMGAFSSAGSAPSMTSGVMPSGGGSSGGGSIVVKEMTLPVRMMMDGREMGTVVEKIMNVKLDPVRPN